MDIVSAMGDVPVNVEDVRAGLIEDGYAIVDNVVPPEHIEQVREFWLDAFKTRSTLSPIIWGPYIGEQNQILFHQSTDDCLYRAYDYLWNEPLHGLSRDLGVGLSRLRNRIAETDEYTGEIYLPDRYGIYFTVSYYPPGDGWLHDHQDESDGRRHWHYILPLSFRGQHYAGGGLHMIDRHGRDVDVDGAVKPGSVLFFDGSLMHGVKPIVSDTDHPFGRMQLFSIPTFLQLPQENDRLAESISISQFIKGKLRPLKHRMLGVRGSVPQRSDFP